VSVDFPRFSFVSHFSGDPFLFASLLQRKVHQAIATKMARMIPLLVFAQGRLKDVEVCTEETAMVCLGKDVDGWPISTTALLYFVLGSSTVETLEILAQDGG
jgi:hypothetical protein